MKKTIHTKTNKFALRACEFSKKGITIPIANLSPQTRFQILLEVLESELEKVKIKLKKRKK